ncbi:MAG: hypothetical protein L3J28_09760 [Candidatus Polarisedimenticolaceae bacterium]|nr:hypothetical protein [Candidatus Polarisedimenticolaceae bacterium]
MKESNHTSTIEVTTQNEQTPQRKEWSLLHLLVICLALGAAFLSLYVGFGALAVIVSEINSWLKSLIPHQLLLLGQLHPVVIHFPITFIVWLAFTEVLGTINNNHKNRKWMNLMFMACCVTSVAAAGAGALYMTVLSFSEEEQTLLNLHAIFQVTATLLICATFVLYRLVLKSDKLEKVYQTCLGLCVVIILTGAHFGGSLVHGTDLFSSIFSAPETEEVSEELMYEDVAPIDFNKEVYPLLKSKCFRCHGKRRQRSKYRLDTRNWAFAGGKTGEPAIVPYNPKKSSLCTRIQLPRDSKKRMPNKGKPLSKEQQKLLCNWINQGAPWPLNYITKAKGADGTDRVDETKYISDTDGNEPQK